MAPFKKMTLDIHKGHGAFVFQRPHFVLSIKNLRRLDIETAEMM